MSDSKHKDVHFVAGKAEHAWKSHLTVNSCLHCIQEKKEEMVCLIDRWIDLKERVIEEKWKDYDDIGKNTK